MFALVKLYFVCPLSSVTKNNQGTCSAKFKDGAYYDVNVVTTHGSFDVLEKLKYSLCSDSPRVVLNRCDLNATIKIEQLTEEVFSKEKETSNFIDHHVGSNARIENTDKDLFGEFKFNNLAHVVKEEVLTEETFIKEEQTFSFTDSSEENVYVENLNSIAVAEEKFVIVNDILCDTPFNSDTVFHDHNYCLWNKINDKKFVSRTTYSWRKPQEEFFHRPEILDNNQNQLKDNSTESADGDDIMVQKDFRVKMDCVPSFAGPADPVLDLNDIMKEKDFKKEVNFDSNLIKRSTDVMSDMPKHPGHVLVKNDDIKLSNEISNNTSTKIPLPEEELPIYDQKVEIKVPISVKRKKKFFCVYCKKTYTRLPRHLERIHKEEEAVEQFCSFPKGSVQRRTVLREIIRKSSFIYNTNQKYNDGDLLVARRPTKGKICNPEEYAPCPECKAFYLKRTLHKHYQRCNTNSKKRRSLLDFQIHSNACEVLKKHIFPCLRDSKSVQIIRYDNLGIAYGNHLCNKYNKSKHYRNIKLYLRYTGNLLIGSKQVDPSVTDLSSLIVPCHVETVVKAINNAAGLEENGQYRSPSMAYFFKKVCEDVAEVWKMECWKSNDVAQLNKAEVFLKHFKQAIGTDMYENLKENILERMRAELKHKQDEQAVPSTQCTNRRWPAATKTKFYKLFAHHLENKTLPSNKQCRMAMQKLPGLRSKTVAAVKTAVLNEIRRRERQAKQAEVVQFSNSTVKLEV